MTMNKVRRGLAVLAAAAVLGSGLAMVQPAEQADAWDINTNQTARTFQDRSYVFRVR
jgi:hypothetical protein